MSELYKKTYRTVMIDNEFPNVPFITLEGFSAKEQIQKCLQAGVDSLHLTSKCHWGFSYYPTKHGTSHPAMKGDMFGELVEACRNNGIEAICYYSVGFDNLAFQKHPQWRKKEIDGKDRICPGMGGEEKWGEVCLNSGYREYMLNQLDELSKNYQIDGIFLDIFSDAYEPTHLVENICRCENCQKLFRKKFPTKSSKEENYRWIKFGKDTGLEVIKEIRKLIQSNRKGISLSFNGYGAENEVLKQLDWVYTEGGENPHNVVIARGLGKKYYQVGIRGGQWVYDLWPPSLVKLQSSILLAHGGRPFFFFTAGRNPDGTFDQAKYDFLKEINSEIVQKQAFVEDVEPYKCVGIVYSDPTIFHEEVQGTYQEHGERIAAAINCLRRLNVPCEIIPNAELGTNSLDEFRLIILPDIKVLSEEEAKYLKEYVLKGGNILATSETGLYTVEGYRRENSTLEEVLGVHFKGLCTEYKNNRTGSYLEFTDHPFFAYLPQIKLDLPGNFVMTELTSAEACAWHVLPIDVEKNDNYVGWEPLPPGRRSDFPAVTTNSTRGGKVVFSSPPLFHYLAKGLKWPAAFLQGLIENLTGVPKVYVHAPGYVEMTCFYQQQKTKMIIHLINHSVDKFNGEIYPIKDIEIKIEKEFFPLSKAEVVWPDKKELEINKEKDGFSMLTPELKIHTIVILEK